MTDDFLFDIPDPGDAGLIPEGRYEVYLQSLDRVTRDNGVQQLKMVLVVCNHEEDQFNGRMLWHYPLIVGKDGTVYSMARDALLAFSPADELIVTLEDGSQVNRPPSDIVGRLALATVVHDEYNGLTRESVKSLRAHPDNPYEHYSPDEDDLY